VRHERAQPLLTKELLRLKVGEFDRHKLCATCLGRTGEARTSETQNQFEGFRGALWLAVGFLLLAAVLGSAAFIVARLLTLL
jgi:hypothetical protein